MPIGRWADRRPSSSEAIQVRVEGLVERHARAFGGSLRRALARGGVGILRWRQLSEEQREALTDTFTDRVFPALTPLAVDPGHPFPYISNGSINLGRAALPTRPTGSDASRG